MKKQIILVILCECTAMFGIANANCMQCLGCESNNTAGKGLDTSLQAGSCDTVAEHLNII